MKGFVLASAVIFSAYSISISLAHAESGSVKHLGETYFHQYCSACHGIDATGNGPVAASLTKPPANLRTIAKRRQGKFPSQEIEQMIDGRGDISAHGSRDMPVWGNVFAEKVGGGSLGEELRTGYITALVEFLKSIQE